MVPMDRKLFLIVRQYYRIDEQSKINGPSTVEEKEIMAKLV
jgi:hypothetical protein